jgi:hypothetical protein
MRPTTPKSSFHAWLRSRAVRLVTAFGLAVTGMVVSAQQSEALVGGDYTGAFSVSATTVRLGGTITATQSATSLAAVQTPGITVCIRRLGFNVVAVQRPATGLCRIAGSATCNFLLLAPHQTQSYVLTLSPTAVGTYQLSGWTTQPIAGGSGGSYRTVTVTVTN